MLAIFAFLLIAGLLLRFTLGLLRIALVTTALNDLFNRVRAGSG